MSSGCRGRRFRSGHADRAWRWGKLAAFEAPLGIAVETSGNFARRFGGGLGGRFRRLGLDLRYGHGGNVQSDGFEKQKDVRVTGPAPAGRNGTASGADVGLGDGWDSADGVSTVL